MTTDTDTDPGPFGPAAPADAVTRLTKMHDSLLVELARTDAKANSLLGIAGVVAAILTSLLIGKSLPGLAAAAVLAAIGTFTTSTLALAVVLRPSLPDGRPRGSFAAWAGHGHAALVEAYLPADDAARIIAAQVGVLAGLVRDKYRRLRVAYNVFIAGLSTTVVVAAVAVVAAR